MVNGKPYTKPYMRPENHKNGQWENPYKCYIRLTPKKNSQW